jgi:hypothetical protein
MERRRQTATPIVYLPSNEDPIRCFCGGRSSFGHSEGDRAIAVISQYCLSGNFATSPASVITTLAAIEQMTTPTWVQHGGLDDVLSQLRSETEEAYRYSLQRQSPRPHEHEQEERHPCVGGDVQLRSSTRTLSAALRILNAMKAAIAKFIN